MMHDGYSKMAKNWKLNAIVSCDQMPFVKKHRNFIWKEDWKSWKAKLEVLMPLCPFWCTSDHWHFQSICHWAWKWLSAAHCLIYSEKQSNFDGELNAIFLEKTIFHWWPAWCILAFENQCHQQITMHSQIGMPTSFTPAYHLQSPVSFVLCPVSYTMWGSSEWWRLRNSPSNLRSPVTFYSTREMRATGRHVLTNQLWPMHRNDARWFKP